jgi:hypothetical protein
VLLFIFVSLMLGRDYSLWAYQTTTSRGDSMAVLTDPTTAACSKPWRLKTAMTASTDEGSHDTSRPPLVLASMVSPGSSLPFALVPWLCCYLGAIYLTRKRFFLKNILDINKQSAAFIVLFSLF